MAHSVSSLTFMPACTCSTATCAFFPGTASSFYYSKKHCTTIILMSASLIGIGPNLKNNISRTGSQVYYRPFTRQPAQLMYSAARARKAGSQQLSQEYLLHWHKLVTIIFPHL